MNWHLQYSKALRAQLETVQATRLEQVDSSWNERQIFHTVSIMDKAGSHFEKLLDCLKTDAEFDGLYVQMEDLEYKERLVTQEIEKVWKASVEFTLSLSNRARPDEVTPLKVERKSSTEAANEHEKPEWTEPLAENKRSDLTKPQNEDKSRQESEGACCIETGAECMIPLKEDESDADVANEDPREVKSHELAEKGHKLAEKSHELARKSHQLAEKNHELVERMSDTLVTLWFARGSHKDNENQRYYGMKQEKCHLNNENVKSLCRLLVRQCLRRKVMLRELDCRKLKEKQPIKVYDPVDPGGM